VLLGGAHLDIQKLRRETQADHLAVEGSMPLMEADLTSAQYAACLGRIYGLVSAWEDRAAVLAPDWLQPTLAARNRADLLKRDLAGFGITTFDSDHPNLLHIHDTPTLLGSMYVMEGSTLGGQFIARHVQQVLHLQDGVGTLYFRSHGDHTGSMWKQFCEVLTQKIPEDQTETVISSAKQMFAAFGAWVTEKSTANVS